MRDDTPRRGALFAIGGRETRRGNTTILSRFASRCGDSEARIVVLSAASRRPQERIAVYEKAFGTLGVRSVRFFHQERREEADDPAVLAAVDEADGVFFTGGNQLKLVTTIAGTALEERVRERHGMGMHVGGTSAGASAMSAVMIARGRGREAARLSSVRLTPGFGFLPDVIVDQHFRERDRYGRLLAAVLCNASMLGFGLDEDTAFILEPDDRLDVIGTGTLTIVDASQLGASNLGLMPDATAVAFAGMRMHVLSSGWAFDLAQRRVEPPALDADRDDLLRAVPGGE